MKFLLTIIFFLFLTTPLLGQSEKPETIVVLVSVMGDVTDTRRQILQNTLTEKLKNHFRLIPQDRYEQAQE